MTIPFVNYYENNTVQQLTILSQALNINKNKSHKKQNYVTIIILKIIFIMLKWSYIVIL